MSLKEQALQASVEQKEGYAATRAAEREKSLDVLMENWADRWRLKLDEPPPLPARSEFSRQTVSGSGPRDGKKTGWAFVIDDVEFIYVDREGMCVVLTCPDCGERQADSWYGIASLGDSLKKQRTLFHKCRQVAARELAYAIRAATDATGAPPDVIFEEALELMRGWRR